MCHSRWANTAPPVAKVVVAGVAALVGDEVEVVEVVEVKVEDLVAFRNAVVVGPKKWQQE